MTYIQTRKAVKELVIRVGLDNIKNYHIIELVDLGHKHHDVTNALNYFRYSKQAKAYR